MAAAPTHGYNHFEISEQYHKCEAVCMHSMQNDTLALQANTSTEVHTRLKYMESRAAGKIPNTTS